MYDLREKDTRFTRKRYPTGVERYDLREKDTNLRVDKLHSSLISCKIKIRNFYGRGGKKLDSNSTSVVSYNEESLVIQANELVRSKQDDLTLLEAKLVRLAVSQVLKADTDFRTYSCNVVDLAGFLGIARQNIYQDIQDLSVSLMKKSIFIKDTQPSKRGKQNYKIFHWVDYIEYKDGVITFKLSESLKPYLLGLEELFTLYSYGALIDLPTTYSIRLYELLVSWVNAIWVEEKPNYTNVPIESNEIIFSVDYLREYFNCLGKYPNAGDFVINVIESSVKAINENTFMDVSFRKVKQGRKIGYIVFGFNNMEDLTPEQAVKWERIKALRERL